MKSNSPQSDKLPPHDLDAESKALACVLDCNKEEQANEYFAQLDELHFYGVQSLAIFRALTKIEVDGGKFNAVALVEQLKVDGQLELVGGIDAIAGLTVPSSANFPSYLAILQDRAARREAIAAAQKAVGEAQNLRQPFQQSEKPKNEFTIRTPDEILEMVFNDDDIIVGDRIIAEGQSCVFVAAGGLGKSRISLQIPACVATGRKFLNFTTGKENSNWLFLQTENSNRRLQSDLRPLKAWLGEDYPKFAARVKFHTLEKDTDSFVNLDSPEAVANIQDAIKLYAPDIVVIDPLNEFAIGDLNTDADMRLTLQTLSRICRKENPKRAIVVLHHALTGKAGASKATGFDRASFGRNSKTLHAWTRAQINLAPVDPDSNDRLIVACGKCSNGREFPTFAVRMNPETMIYECDPTVDVTQWEKDVTGAKDTAPLMNPDRVRELCSTAGSTKAALAKAIMDDCGCYRGSAYRYITRAEQAKKITFNKTNETYFRK